jgi:hypothetical protein
MVKPKVMEKTRRAQRPTTHNKATYSQRVLDSLLCSKKIGTLPSSGFSIYVYSSAGGDRLWKLGHKDR